MRNCVTLVANTASAIDSTDSDYVGIDKGALFLAKRGIRMVFAIGDFDSITEEEKQEVIKMSDTLIQLQPMKNESDSQEAITECIRRGYKQGTFYGALGKRFDHHYVNQQLCIHSVFKLVLIDEKNKMFMLEKGIHKIKKSGFTYISLFAQENATVTFSGLKYCLTEYELNEKNLIGLSNEIMSDACTIEVHKGRLLCIQAKD